MLHRSLHAETSALHETDLRWRKARVNLQLMCLLSQSTMSFDWARSTDGALCSNKAAAEWPDLAVPEELAREWPRDTLGGRRGRPELPAQLPLTEKARALPL